ncbi:MAG: 4Fe-4S dicluster domain-containing protein [Deltaproteobacteria bacterium]|nr:4Fe-4S dicluster domain-containing protein [Deltaproteobacteria bacterium]
MEHFIVRELEPSARHFLKEVERLSGQNIFKCMQCGTCSAGCPALLSSDLAPNQTIHRMMIGRIVELESAGTAWRCMSCRLCRARCPRGLDMARILAAFRQFFLAENRERALQPESFTEMEDLQAPQILLVGALRDHGA